MGFLVAVDIGGTFTDFVLHDTASGAIRNFKVPSTPKDFAEGFVDGFKHLLEENWTKAADISAVFHGTTVSTNALIEGRIPKLGLLTTQGMRDVLEIRRHWRSADELYNFFMTVQPPLVPRDRRKEVVERVLAGGRVALALDEKALRATVGELIEAGVEAVAVCLLHAYAHPDHELRVREIVRQMWPEAPISVSHEVCGELREYERTSTTVLNSALLPVMRAYLRRLEGELRGLGVPASLQIMQSNGGLMTPDVVADRPVTTLLSGPVGGVMGAIHVGRQVGERNLITIDMGGTSSDICLVENGQPNVTTEKEVAGNPVRVPMFDMVAIGAGGGSIAWIDPGGRLQVGPRSAGASPGPACFGLGGGEATITDANLVLGRIRSGGFLGGRVRLTPALAEAAVQRIAEPLGMSLREAALGIVEIANAKMIESIKVVSIKRGHDPRDFALVAGGGAGPLHGAFLAAELQMRRVIVPTSPGTLSAFGLLTADVKFDLVRTHVRQAGSIELDIVERILAELGEIGAERVRTSRTALSDLVIAAYMDLRYFGQAYELTIPVRGRPVDAASLETAVDEFHREHRRLFGYEMRDETVELVNLRVQARGQLPPPRDSRVAGGSASPPPDSVIDTLDVTWSGGDVRPTAIYRRSALRAGNRLAGPAVIEQFDSTTAIPPGATAEVDGYGNLILERAR